MAIEEQHIALPRLYGAPAYARPRTMASTAERPFDPDDLPIEAFQSEEDRVFAATLPARAWASGGTSTDGNGGRHGPAGSNGQRALHARPLNLRAIAGRLLGSD